MLILVNLPCFVCAKVHAGILLEIPLLSASFPLHLTYPCGSGRNKLNSPLQTLVLRVRNLYDRRFYTKKRIRGLRRKKDSSTKEPRTFRNKLPRLSQNPNVSTTSEAFNFYPFNIAAILFVVDGFFLHLLVLLGLYPIHIYITASHSLVRKFDLDINK